MTEIADVAAAEELIRAIDELKVAVLTLNQTLMRFEVVYPDPPRRPIEERDLPLPTIQQDDETLFPRRATDE